MRDGTCALVCQSPGDVVQILSWMFALVPGLGSQLRSWSSQDDSGWLEQKRTGEVNQEFRMRLVI